MITVYPKIELRRWLTITGCLLFVKRTFLWFLIRVVIIITTINIYTVCTCSASNVSYQQAVGRWRMKFLEVLWFFVFLGHLLHVQSLKTSYSRLIRVKVPVKQLILKNRSKRLFSTLSWTFQKHPKDFIVGSMECSHLHFS